MLIKIASIIYAILLICLLIIDAAVVSIYAVIAGKWIVMYFKRSFAKKRANKIHGTIVGRDYQIRPVESVS